MTAELDLSAHTCPRRVEGPRYDVTGEDTWTDGHSLSATDQPAGPGCSYCGSLHPARFMDLLEHHDWMVGPTDKTYKAYVMRPLTDDEQAAGRARFDQGREAQAIRETGARADKTDEQIQAELDRYWAEMVAPGTEARTVGKFYFQHLDEAQKRHFVDLYNAGTLRFGYPGHLYVLPFFMARA